ncbi:hypothetical protein PybrP1_006020 [[Pythium] brassicae (nom. inval.)]|nr:hypothetical protein PybrP1_006020 [[Pythium] brassicae (nom. inval.)]
MTPHTKNADYVTLVAHNAGQELVIASAPIRLQSAGVASRGEKSDQQLATAKNHFNKFLQSHGDSSVSDKSTDTLTHPDVTAEMLGCFATYLFMTLKKMSGVLPYLSQVMGLFTGKWQGCTRWELHPNNASDQWYSDIRAGLRHMYTNRATAEGESLVDQAPPMHRSSLRQVATALFFADTAYEVEERDLIFTEWHCMGRASETGIRNSAVKYVSAPTGALQFAVGRPKTNSLQLVHAFYDADPWEADIFHSKACHHMTSTNADAIYHFRAASTAVINRILTRVCAVSGLEQRFQSHSGRRDCASEALSHNGVSVTEVINRGGWAFDAVS